LQFPEKKATTLRDLYGFETWSVIREEENVLRALRIKTLRTTAAWNNGINLQVNNMKIHKIKFYQILLNKIMQDELRE